MAVLSGLLWEYILQFFQMFLDPPLQLTAQVIVPIHPVFFICYHYWLVTDSPPPGFNLTSDFTCNLTATHVGTNFPIHCLLQNQRCLFQVTRVILSIVLSISSRKSHSEERIFKVQSKLRDLHNMKVFKRTCLQPAKLLSTCSRNWNE